MKNGWKIKKIGEVCNLMTGGTPSKSKPEYFKNGKIKWLVSGDIHKKEILDCDGRITEEGMENSNAKYLPVNSVMIALNGQGKTKGSVAILRTKATCNQSLISIFPKDKVDLLPEYIYCYLQGKYDEIRKITGDTGNDRRGLNMPLIRNIPIPIAPFSEQKRIVNILNELFAAIDKAKANTEKNLYNVRELFESYLQEVFENEVFETKTIQDISKVVNGYAFSSKDFKSTNKLKSIKITNVGVGEFVEEDGNYLPEKHGKQNIDVMVKEGAIVIALTRTIISNGLKVALVPKNYDGALVNQRVAALIANEDIINYKFLFNYLQTSEVRKYVLAHVNTLMQPNLSINDLKNLHVPCPSLNTQKKIVERLEKFKSEIQILEKIFWKKVENLEDLKKSILERAFAGELN